MAKSNAEAALKQLREICLALPEATEKLTWGEHPTFRVRDKIFAMFGDGARRDGRPSMHCKALPGAQDVLVGSDPGRFFVPGYVGPHGWIGVWLDDPDWSMVADLVVDSYKMKAPKKLTAELP